MLANRTNLNNLFPLPITSTTKWWKEMTVDKAFKKGNNYRINAGASCAGGALIDDKDKKDKKGGNDTVANDRKKKTPSKDNKKGSKKEGKK